MTDEGDPEDEWPLASTCEVGKRNRIRAPEWLYEQIGTRASLHSEHKQKVKWGIEKNSSFVVLSEYDLRKPSFDHLTESIIHRNAQDSGTYFYLELPQAVRERTTKFVEGTDVVYFARDEMVNDENSSAYLLTLSELTNLLPGVVRDGEDARQAIANNPGFFSSL
jgi:hypothetical protein